MEGESWGREGKGIKRCLLGVLGIGSGFSSLVIGNGFVGLVKSYKYKS